MKYGTAGTNPAGRGVRVASDAFWGVALQLRTCAGALALGFLAAASTLVLRGQAQAQTFVYASINSLHTIPVVIDDNQWVPDIFPNGGPAGSGTGRYAPNLNMRFRIIANPRVRAAGLVYSELDLDSTTTFGVNDTVDFRWYDNTGAASTRTSGPWSPGTTTGLAFPSGSFASNSLMFPGARFTFRSGPTWNGSGTFVETEDTGLRTSGIQINGTGTMGSSSVPVLSPHERVLGVVLANDDVVDMRLPATASPATVALWLENPNTSSVKLWARCVALPSATAFDQAMSTAPASLFPTWQGASLRLPACAGGWFLSVTNTSTTDRVFHLVWGVHEAEQALTSVRIGVAFTATTAELATMRANFQTAAWLWWAMTGGSRPIIDFRLINGATQCDDPWPADQYACEGVSCRFCLVPANAGDSWNGGPCRSYNSDATGMVSLCRTTGWDDPLVIVHEMGHSYIGLPDEYHDTSSTCPGPSPRSWPLCWHSMMAGYQGTRSFCTDLAHRQIQEDWRGFAGPASFAPVSNGPVAWDCAGYALWTNASSMWGVINAHAPFDHPQDWSPHNLSMPGFRGDPMLGTFSRLF